MTSPHVVAMRILCHRLKTLHSTILPRGCHWLLPAVGLILVVAQADAAQLDRSISGATLLDYLHACGIGDEAFAKFNDDRQIAAEELDVIRRIAVRLRDCPPGGQIANLPGSLQVGNLPRVAEAQGKRGRSVELQGDVVSVEPVEDPGREPLWRCIVTSAALPGRVVVYVAELPEKLRSAGSGQRVVCAGVFVKYVPGAAAVPMAVVVAPRLEWRPESLAMDFGLFDGIHDRSPLEAADRDAFYGLLRLTRRADLERPSFIDPLKGRDAERLDDMSTLFRDPAAQRGRLLTLSGIPRRVVRVPIDDAATAARLGADHYFEIDIVPEGSPSNPAVFCTLELPEGLSADGPSMYGENLEATGFFLKLWEYPTALSAAEKAVNPGSSQAWQTAPLLIGPAPSWRPAPNVAKESSHFAAIVGLLALGIAGVCLLLWHLRTSRSVLPRGTIVHSSARKG
jgi:hypothetical protein